MKSNLSEAQIYELAKKRVDQKKGFFIHLIIYVIVNIGLVLIWAFVAGGGFMWFFFPLVGWGIGVLFHYLGIFVFSKQSEWDKKAIEKEIERIRKDNSV